MSNKTNNANYTNQYFQRRIDDLTTEIDRIKARILRQQEYLQQWPESESIKEKLQELEAGHGKLVENRLRYLQRNGGSKPGLQKRKNVMSNTSEIKKSKVKEIIQVKPFTGQYGTTYYFMVELENGDKGEVAKKKPDALAVGNLLEYTVEIKDGFVRFKEVRPAFQKRSGGTSSASTALEAAAMITAANIQASGKMMPMDLTLAKKVTDLAGHFHTWLKSEDK